MSLRWSYSTGYFLLRCEMGGPVGSGEPFTLEIRRLQRTSGTTHPDYNTGCAYQYEGAEVHDLYSLIVKPAGQQMGRPEGVQIG
jgi:hypothetical protein